MAAIVHGPGEGETVSARDEHFVQIKVDLDAIAVTESRFGPGERGPDRHIHERHVDAFWVLEGELVFGLAERDSVSAGAGSFVLAPPRLVHTFGSERQTVSRFLNFHVPDSGFAESLRARRDDREPTIPFDAFGPPADGGRPASEAVVLGSGEGERLVVGGSSVVFKATGDATGGTFFLSETTVEPGFPGPPLHVHRELHDLFYVLEGTLALRVGDDEVEGPAGTFACFPPGAVHTFSNPGNEAARFLNFNTPAGWERYMRDLAAAAAGGQLDGQTIGRVASRYDIVLQSSPEG